MSAQCLECLWMHVEANGKNLDLNCRCDCHGTGVKPEPNENAAHPASMGRTGEPEPNKCPECGSAWQFGRDCTNKFHSPAQPEPEQPKAGTCWLCGEMQQEHAWSDHKYDPTPRVSTAEPTNKEVNVSNTEFYKELTDLLNKYSRENASNTPDFILASYLIACLEAYNRATQEREKFTQ